MRSSWSLGLVFIVLGGMSVSGIGGHRPIGPVPWLLAGLLVVTGAVMFTRTRAALWVAIIAGLVTVITGAIGLAHHPELALAIPPAYSIGFGLYLVFRSAVALSGMRPNKTRGFLPRDEPPPEVKA